MCGIAGIINFQSTINNHQDIVNKFHNDLKHRGPDSKGYYFSSSSNALLCQTRLSIIDTSDNANQPIESYDKRFNIIFNGEIYNYKELNKIIYEKFNIHTKSDTEVLLYMYIEYGSECLQYISGMFSFVIWDNLKQEVFIARDPLGIKPFYYHFSNNRLFFCSEIKPLIQSKQFDCQINYDAIYSYLRSGNFHEPDTIIKGINILESGHYIKFNKDSFNKKKYIHQNQANNKQIGYNETLNNVKNSFKKSIVHHLESDVPIGLFLSSGIDSTSVLSTASKFSEINTISIGFKEKEFDESIGAKEIAKYYRSKHHEYIISEEEVIDSLDDFINTIDQPTIDGLNTYFISKFTNKLGFKVALSGAGGDELFGGYPSFKRMYLINQYFKYKKYIGIDNQIKHFVSKKKIKNYNRIIDIVESKNLFDSYVALKGIFSKSEATFITNKISDQNKNYTTKDCILPNDKKMSINSKTRFFEKNNYLKNQLLRDADVFGMRWSTEIRTPFVDYNFASNIESLPEKYIFAKKKDILIKALDLPKKLISKDKKGFTFPFKSWLQQSLGKEIEHEIDGIIDSNSDWYQIWTLFILQKWIKNNIG